MNHPGYPLITKHDDLSVFYFTSEGKNGEVKKIIAFTATIQPNIYNLGMGDILPDGKLVDDLVVTNNGDRNKVLATVVYALYLYTKRYPDRWVAFKGSTPSRTRLYRMALNLYFTELNKYFHIYSIVDGKTQPFSGTQEATVFFIKGKNG